ncbi:MAG: pyruvate kinase [Methanosarcinales archaeon]|nr:pyruvate kinase [Methanosarcinales archaeon]
MGGEIIRRTKIVCTIGPASSSESNVKRLIEAGMDVARLNFSHGTHEEHRINIKKIREISTDLDRHIAILQDLSGPKIRVGEFPDGAIALKSNNEFILTNRNVPGNEHIASVSYKDLPGEVKSGDTIMLSDGLIQFRVIETDTSDIRCKVEVGGQLSSHKGINLPAGTVNIPSLTEKDREDLELGIREEIDLIALSFVREAGDILEIKQIISDRGASIPVIAKIEKHEAVANIDRILEAADGIMVARGDLGVEIPMEDVPAVQKMLVRKSNQAGKPVITATQMLRSMVENPRPTRAETADVANAVLDGTDAVMLSEETAVGQFPVGAVHMMSRIAAKIESSVDFQDAMSIRNLTKGESITEAIGRSAIHIASQVNAAAIITPTGQGNTARVVARYRPLIPIYALSSNPATLRGLSLVWGVKPIYVDYSTDINVMMKRAVKTAVEWCFKPGDKLVVTASVPTGGSTNMIKVEVI